MKLIKIRGMIINCSNVTYLEVYFNYVHIHFVGSDSPMKFMCDDSEKAKELQEKIYKEMISE